MRLAMTVEDSPFTEARASGVNAPSITKSLPSGASVMAMLSSAASCSRKNVSDSSCPAANNFMPSCVKRVRSTGPSTVSSRIASINSRGASIWATRNSDRVSRTLVANARSAAKLPAASIFQRLYRYMPTAEMRFVLASS